MKGLVLSLLVVLLGNAYATSNDTSGAQLSSDHAPDPQAPQAPQSQVSAPPTSPCSEGTARDVGRLYYALNPVNELTRPNEVMEFVASNGRFLVEDGPLIRCARLAGHQLEQQGFASFDSRSADRAYESALNMGADMEQARSVAASMSDGSLDAILLGQELLWLAQVVPPAARGDWGPFSTTGTQLRLQLRQVWPVYQEMLNFDPSVRALVDQVLTDCEPWVEYQVAVLAYWAGN